MNYFKKMMSFLLCFLMFITVFSAAKPANAAVAMPKVEFVGVDHSPLVVGDKESFYITTNYSGAVQYRIFLYIESTKKYEELTKGYSTPFDGKTPFKVSPSKIFQLGRYRVLTYVKRAGSTGAYKDSRAGGYDSLYTSYLNCVTRDNSNRVYANDEMDIEKDTYTIGEKVVINGIKNISGMSGPYTYKLHIYNPGTMQWTVDSLPYRSSIEWTPSKPGIYVLDLWGISSNSTLWTLINRNPSAKLYEAWKLKVITVKEPDKYISVKEDTPLLISPGGIADERYAVAGEKFGVYEEKDGYYKIKSGKVFGFIPTDKADVLATKPQDKINIAWQPIYYETSNIYTYDDPTDYVNRSSIDIGLDAISPTWFYIKGDASNPSSIYAGEILDNEYVKKAHRNGYEVWPRFYEDDPDRARVIFNNTSIRSKVINDVVQYALDANADGINIDFEGLGTYTENKSGFTAFVRDLSVQLHDKGLNVSVDVTRPQAYSRYSTFYDRAALSQYCDYVMLMAYDEYYLTSQQPGSVGSYSWVEDSINKTIQDGVPKDKLILGDPFYSVDYGVIEVKTPVAYNTAVAVRNTMAYNTLNADSQYKVSDINAGDVLKRIAISPDGNWYTVTVGSVQAYVQKADFVAVPANGSGMWVYSAANLRMKDSASTISSYNAVTSFDESAKQTVAAYIKDGIKHVVWLENIDSMNWRIDFVNNYGLKGAGAWALGFETQDIWDAFKRLK